MRLIVVDDGRDVLRSPNLVEGCEGMPAKKTALTDAERAKRMRELAREVGASNDPGVLDQALGKVAKPTPGAAKSPQAAKK